MTNNKDPLLELCKPFLLDLSAAIIETLKFPEEPIYETAEKLESTSRLKTRDYDNISDLTEIQKIQVLSKINAWMLEGDRPNHQ